MTRDELLARLRSNPTWSRGDGWDNLVNSDPEADHAAAERDLLDFIGDEEIRAAWNHLADHWWYA